MFKPLLLALATPLLFGVSYAADLRSIHIDVTSPTTQRDHFTDFSVGSDYPGTLMREDSLAQLQTVKAELGFRYLRFHGIFHDVLNTYTEHDGKPVYDWTKIDYLYDRLLRMGIKPFVELGFTPHAMRGSDKTIFYWKGNISHPDPVKWTALVDAFVRHLQARYGREEVRSWYFEVWNEPNLAIFWEGADQAAYFDLYERSARAIKAIDPQLKVGGPATAGAAWVPEFLAFTQKTGAPVDFVTTHTYGVDGGFIDEHGVSDTKLSTSPHAVTGDVKKVRAQIKASARPDLPLFFTEWSSSYTPRDPVHDSYISAAYILSKLKSSEAHAQGMSYWTYTDLFEEPGPPTASFQGGFGLLNPEGIRKPAYFAYKYLHQLGEAVISTQDPQSYVTRTEDGALQVLAWDYRQPVQDKSNRGFYTTVLPSKNLTPLELDVSGLQAGDYTAYIYRTGFRSNDAHTAYLEMGSPARLSTTQLKRLQDLTTDQPELRQLKVQQSGKASIKIDMRENDVVLVRLLPR
ncbi:cellulase family glycosylhydrolase [Undibacterium sp. CY18W]|uniref:Cellulase family glycosylhydrolase n=1 Tax=Undibacterium hunanense TaxID=2762292 RepID=A0ABR6ZR12_9BURK|nr:cellulase family glycosylhydrolase [Undibacterium hunanense]MBC3918273.1 cellulase family glycosylhydrolase [Undibacterium hunanense]